MITIFSTCKPFVGHIGVIQRNALESWTRLQPRPEIVLFGEEEGTALVASELNLRHVSDISRTERGTPLVSDLFAQAQRLAGNTTLAYVNADIILMSDFMVAVKRMQGRNLDYLMIGQRWDLDINRPVDFTPEWERCLRDRVSHQGKLHAPTGIDFFVFDAGHWPTLPPFAIGRVGYDNWLVYDARRRGSVVVDATAVVMAVHQNHDYRHLPGGSDGIQSSPDAIQNLTLVGHDRNAYTIMDASWLLKPYGLVPAIWPRHLLCRFWRTLQHATRLKATLRWLWQIVRLGS